MLAPDYLYKVQWYPGEKCPKRDVYAKRVKHSLFYMPPETWRLHKGCITLWTFQPNAKNALIHGAAIALTVNQQLYKEGYYNGKNSSGVLHRPVARTRILFLARLWTRKKTRKSRRRYLDD